MKKNIKGPSHLDVYKAHKQKKKDKKKGSGFGTRGALGGYNSARWWLRPHHRPGSEENPYVINDNRILKDRIDDLNLRDKLGLSEKFVDPDPYRTELEQRFRAGGKKLRDDLYERLKMLHQLQMDFAVEAIIKERLKSCKKKKRF